MHIGEGHYLFEFSTRFDCLIVIVFFQRVFSSIVGLYCIYIPYNIYNSFVFKNKSIIHIEFHIFTAITAKNILLNLFTLFNLHVN